MVTIGQDGVPASDSPSLLTFVFVSTSMVFMHRLIMMLKRTVVLGLAALAATAVAQKEEVATKGCDAVSHCGITCSCGIIDHDRGGWREGSIPY